MTNVSVRNGWESLPNGFDVEFRTVYRSGFQSCTRILRACLG